MTYIVETWYSDGHTVERAIEVATIDEAREEAASRLGVAALDPEMRGGCPDDEDREGVECWMPYDDADHIPEGTVGIYRIESAA